MSRVPARSAEREREELPEFVRIVGSGRAPISVFKVMFKTINHAEAALWCAIGIGFLIVAIAVPRNRSRCILLGVVFIAFGGSDVVEVQTGAWWRPWWLLGWKAACLLVMVQQLTQYRSASRRVTPPARSSLAEQDRGEPGGVK
jgi:hypothetical protein